MSNNTIDGNSAEFGGGICIAFLSSAVITDNVITDNSTRKDHGGGIYCYQSSTTVSNNTITENVAEEGGGISIQGNSTVTLSNTILWGNDAPTGPEIYVGDPGSPSTIMIGYSDIEGGETSVYVESGCSVDWGEGVIDSAPRFSTYHGFDYLLHRNSPCIDTGDPALEDGFDWPDWYLNGSRSDMGAYGGPGNVGWLP